MAENTNGPVFRTPPPLLTDTSAWDSLWILLNSWGDKGNKRAPTTSGRKTLFGSITVQNADLPVKISDKSDLFFFWYRSTCSSCFCTFWLSFPSETDRIVDMFHKMKQSKRIKKDDDSFSVPQDAAASVTVIYLPRFCTSAAVGVCYQCWTLYLCREHCRSVSHPIHHSC